MNRPIRLTIVAFVVVFTLRSPAAAQDVVDGFEARTFSGSPGQVLLYRLFSPSGRDGDRSRFPLIIYLHGSGGLGDDNVGQLSGGNAYMTRFWTSAAVQTVHPAFVLAPQIRVPGWSLPASDELAPSAILLIQLVESLLRDLPIDADRVYLTGQSMGGHGTWDIATKRPDLFAAAVPLCGTGVPTRAKAIQGLPVWVFHGAQDPQVPVSGSRDVVAALRSLGSSVRYTEYRDVGHNVWARAVDEPGLADWVFSHER